jgi:hypothetical protein
MRRIVWASLTLFLLTMIGMPSARADGYKPRPAAMSGGIGWHDMGAVRGADQDSKDMLFSDLRRYEGGRFDSAAFFAGLTGRDGRDGDQGSIFGSSGSRIPTGPAVSTTTAPAVVATPEPGTIALMMLGLGLLLATRKRLVPNVSRV